MESGEFLSRLISWLLLDVVNVAATQMNAKNLIYNDVIAMTDPSAPQTVTDVQGPWMPMMCRHEHASQRVRTKHRHDSSLLCILVSPSAGCAALHEQAAVFQQISTGQTQGEGELPTFLLFTFYRFVFFFKSFLVGYMPISERLQVKEESWLMSLLNVHIFSK